MQKENETLAEKFAIDTNSLRLLGERLIELSTLFDNIGTGHIIPVLGKALIEFSKLLDDIKTGGMNPKDLKDAQRKIEDFLDQENLIPLGNVQNIIEAAMVLSDYPPETE